MPEKIDVTGKVFGRLTVQGDAPRAANGRRRVQCLCQCGQYMETDPRLLLAGQAQSCGCLQKERVSQSAIARQTTHGRSGTPEYLCWVHMKGRCLNPNNSKYPQYGQRGITVCQEWADSFEVFFDYVGPRPSPKHSLDRIDTDGNYEPGNVRWADAKSQSRNKRNHRLIDFDGRIMPLSEACELAGVNYRSALYRLNRGKHWMPLPPAPVLESE